MTVYGYARVSTTEQAGADRSSLDDQATTIRHAAGMKRQEVAEVFVDPGISGSVPLDKRPAGIKLLETLQAGDTLIVAKMDRLFRSTADALNTVDRFKVDQIALVLCDMGSEPVTENGVGRLFLTMMAAVAEFERARIHERMLEGKRAKQARGGLVGGSPPYGYSVVGKGHSATLVPNPEEQGLIQVVRTLAATGRAIEGIRGDIERRGFRNRHGKPFAWVQIRRMIEAPERET